MSQVTLSKKNKRVLSGYVCSDKMDKTIVVVAESLKKHSKYKKYIRQSKKIKVHDEYEKAKKGDKVECIECRPLSREKSFRLIRIVETSKESII